MPKVRNHKWSEAASLANGLNRHLVTAAFPNPEQGNKKGSMAVFQANRHAANQPMKTTGPEVQRVPEGLLVAILPLS